MTPNSFRKTVYTDMLPDAATVLWTYASSRRGIARIAFAAFTNTSGAAATATLAIVPAGGTITDAKYRILDEQSLDAKQSLWYFEDAGVDGSVSMSEGDQIVAFSDTASVVSARIVVQETNPS